MHVPFKGSLRQKILASVGALVILSLLSSAYNLYRMVEVSRFLEAVNHVSVPLGRLFTQMLADTEVMLRESEKSLGKSNWKDPLWKAKPAPQWIEDVIRSELGSVRELMRSSLEWTPLDSRLRWTDWGNRTAEELESFISKSDQLFTAYERADAKTVEELYPRWLEGMEHWKSQIQWGATEYERILRLSFATAEARVVDLRNGLEVILIAVVLMSLLLLWLGEMALRPLDDLSQLARRITQRGLHQEDKALFPEVPLSRSDEVSSLTREFHAMAVALLEREKMVEAQRRRLQEQNRLLRKMGELESLAAIGRMSAQVAHEVRNPLHSIGLEAEMAVERAEPLGDGVLNQSLDSILKSVDRLQKITENYLKLSKLSEGKKEAVDLERALKAVLETYAPSCSKWNIAVEWSLNWGSQASSKRVWGDPALLEQAFGNLIQNALQAFEEEAHAQFSPQPEFIVNKVRKIRIALEDADAGWIKVSLSDNGPGISNEVLSKIFEPFFTTKPFGTGLGLSYVRKVIEDQGGKVRCFSLAKGVRFEVTLPAVDPTLEINALPMAKPIQETVGAYAENTLNR